MREVRRHARAEEDLVDIWLYSLEEWGDVQTDQYRHPNRGTSRSNE